MIRLGDSLVVVVAAATAAADDDELVAVERLLHHHKEATLDALVSTLGREFHVQTRRPP